MDYKKIIVGNKYFLFLLVFVFLLVSGIFNVSAFNLEEDNLNNGDYTVYREQIVIGKPVKWVAVVNKTSGEEGVEINIPKNAKGINILKGEKVEETIREVKEGRSNITDEDLQVRKAVAERLPEVSLGLMKNDKAPEVRRIIAQRIADDEAIEFLNDEDWIVRYTAARHVPIYALDILLTDAGLCLVK